MNNREAAYKHFMQEEMRIGKSYQDIFNAGFLSGLASQQDHIPNVGKMVQSQAQQESKELGHPYGIVDPDYARIYTQSRIIAWQYGYSCLMHGSFTRDLDLLLVPWEESARDNHDQLLKLIADACGLQFKDGEKEIYKAKVDWTNKPHGRKSCSLFFKEARDRRWIDIAVLPVSPPAPEGE